MKYPCIIEADTVELVNDYKHPMYLQPTGKTKIIEREIESLFQPEIGDILTVVSGFVVVKYEVTEVNYLNDKFYIKTNLIK